MPTVAQQVAEWRPITIDSPAVLDLRRDPPGQRRLDSNRYQVDQDTVAPSTSLQSALPNPAGCFAPTSAAAEEEAD
jgi:hypothetical protein